jgi:hypothetical protein
MRYETALINAHTAWVDWARYKDSLEILCTKAH